MSPEYFDILATCVLGVLGVWAREIYGNYDPKNTIETSPLRFMLMIIPGMFSGFMGGEVASLMGSEANTWLFALVIGYGGAPVLEMLVQAVTSIMKKGLEAAGVKFEEYTPPPAPEIAPEGKRFEPELIVPTEEKKGEMVLV